jgi:hypothetical protein
LVALADQYAGCRLGCVNPALYRIGCCAWHHQALHDISAGNNTPASPGHRIKG